jgi:biopolymer transport protein ExbB
MFEDKTILEIFQLGGWVMYVLLLCSILSLGILIEKIIEFRKKFNPSRKAIMVTVRSHLEKKDMDGTKRFCQKFPKSPFCSIVNTWLSFSDKSVREIENAMEREITDQIAGMEKRTIVVGTIANLAVYVGLFGTVLGIVNAFHSIAKAGTGSGGLSLVIQGVSEALLNTAMGLGVAIPAVVFYNWIMKRITSYTREMDSTAGELLDIAERLKTEK